MKKFKEQLLDAATEPFRPAGRFAWHFARGKLGGDPAFFGLLQLGAIPNDAAILDLGCGQGLLAAWLIAARRLFNEGQWPEALPPPPQSFSVRGIELMAPDVERAKRALGDGAQFEQGDIRTADFGKASVVVILDVLHYIDHAAQQKVLERVRDALRPGGTLLLRIGDADGGFGFRYSQWVDRTIAFLRGHGVISLHCRPLAEWVSVLTELGFEVEAVPMSEGTPFANVLLRAKLKD